MKFPRSFGNRALPNQYFPTPSVTVHFAEPVKPGEVERVTPGPESRKPSVAERSRTEITTGPVQSASSGPSADFDVREMKN